MADEGPYPDVKREVTDNSLDFMERLMELPIDEEKRHYLVEMLTCILDESFVMGMQQAYTDILESVKTGRLENGASRRADEDKA